MSGSNEGGKRRKPTSQPTLTNLSHRIPVSTPASRAPWEDLPSAGARQVSRPALPHPLGASNTVAATETSISPLCNFEQIIGCGGLDRRRFPALASASPIALTLASELPSKMRTTHASQLLALFVVSTLAITSAQNVSLVLSNYPQFSTFARLLVETDVVSEIQTRSSITLLLPDNGVLDPYVASHPSYTTQEFADVLRYHTLLQYYGGEELATLTSVGYIVTTLYQTTGRANGLNGFVNLTKTATGTVTVGPSTPLSPPQANIITNITQYPYNYSFLQISAVLEPLGLAAVPTPAPSLAPVGSPLSPIESPIESPAEAPVNGPVSSPPVAGGPEAGGPVAEGPGVEAASNAAYAVGFNAGAVFASLAVAAMLL